MSEKKKTVGSIKPLSPQLQKWLSRKGFTDINTPNDLYPLELAVLENNLAIVKELLRSGAEPNMHREGEKSTLPILLLAVSVALREAKEADDYKTCLSMLKVLVKYNANINCQVYMGREYQPLLYIMIMMTMQTASDSQDYKFSLAAVKVLLEHNADPNIQLKSAKEQQILLSVIIAHTINNLREAADYKFCLAVIKLLLKHNSDPNSYVKIGIGEQPLLLVAVEGAMRNFSSAASRKFSLSLIQLLLEHDANPNVEITFERGNTVFPLIFESILGISDSVVTSESNIKGADYRYFLSILQLLLEYGADPNVSISSEGDVHPILFLAITAFITRANDIHDPKTATVIRAYLSIIQLLLEFNADPNVYIDIEGVEQPLLFAVITIAAEYEDEDYTFCLAIITLLLTHNADPNIAISVEDQKMPLPELLQRIIDQRTDQKNSTFFETVLKFLNHYKNTTRDL